MKTVLFIVIALFGLSTAHGQSLKKKYCGDYSGDIPAYSMDFEGATVQVKSSTIKIVLLLDGTCEYILNGRAVKGVYRVIQEDNSSITILAEFDKNTAPEEWVYYKKEKRLERKGVYPQPDAFLTKKS